MFFILLRTPSYPRIGNILWIIDGCHPSKASYKMYTKSDTIILKGDLSMEKTETIHIRIDPRLKKESEDILSRLGVNTSYAVNMFLQQLVYQKAFPFEVALPKENNKEKTERLAYAINMTGGKEPSPKAKKIIHLYVNGDIDYETAVFAIRRLTQKS